jgi:enoyl-CoA hydratase/carnithine racemase
MDFIRYEHHNEQIAVITLNRPERLNALGSQMRLEFEEALQAAARDPEVRVAIVTGAGRSFCAGADIKEWAAGTPPIRPPQEATQFLTEYGTPDVIKPLVAAINGHCLGAGLNLVATRCDVRIAGSTALFGMPEVARGTIDLTTPFALEGLPRAFLSELLFTGDPVTAARAYEVGLINAVVPNDDVMATAVSMAERIAQHSPAAVRATKLNLLKTFEATQAAQVWEQRLREQVTGSGDTSEGMQAFVDKRSPLWDQGEPQSDESR